MARRETFSTAADAVSRAQSEGYASATPSHQCAAQDCPMPGTISDTVVGEAPRRWCRYHFGAGYTDLALITAKLKNRSPLVYDELHARRTAHGSAGAALRLDHAMTTDAPWCRAEDARARHAALDAALVDAAPRGTANVAWAHAVLRRYAETPQTVSAGVLNAAIEALTLGPAAATAVRAVGTVHAA